MDANAQASLLALCLWAWVCFSFDSTSGNSVMGGYEWRVRRQQEDSSAFPPLLVCLLWSLLLLRPNTLVVNYKVNEMQQTKISGEGKEELYQV